MRHRFKTCLIQFVPVIFYNCTFCVAHRMLFANQVENLYDDKTPDKSFPNKTELQCYHRCTVTGFKYVNFYSGGRKEDFNHMGTCNCFKSITKEDLKVNENWHFIEFEETPGKVKEEDHIVDGGFTEWSKWSQCSVTCAGGEQKRHRSCTNPTPSKHGLNCEGDTNEKRNCNENPCPINGGFTEWSSWTTCTRTCGGGSIKRTRDCTNPPPQFGGSDCSGERTETSTCNTYSCPTDICTFQVGDAVDENGQGTSITSTNDITSIYECLSICSQQRIDRPSINGVVFNQSNSVCECEEGMVARDDVTIYQSCFFGQ